MALKINTLGSGPEQADGWHEITERLYLTEDDRVVPDGHPDARWLWATPGQRIRLSEAKRRGLVKQRKAAAAGLQKKPADQPLSGRALNQALKAAGLPTGGKVAEKRARLAEWQADAGDAEPPAE